MKLSKNSSNPNSNLLDTYQYHLNNHITINSNYNNLQSPSVLTKLTAPHASFDYQQSEPSVITESGDGNASELNKPQVYDVNNNQMKSKLTQASYSVIDSNVPINVKEIVEECIQCKSYAAKFSNKNMTHENEELLNENSKLMFNNVNNIEPPSEDGLNASKNEFKGNGCTNILFYCCYNKMSETRFCICFKWLRLKTKKLVDSNIFQRSILFGILVNTLSMGIEHHEQVNFIHHLHLKSIRKKCFLSFIPYGYNHIPKTPK